MLYKHDVALDFLRCCGVDIGIDCSRSLRHNESLSYPEMLVLVYLFKHRSPGEPHSLISQVGKARRKAFGLEPLSGYVPTQDEVISYQMTYNASNLWISRNFFCGRQIFSAPNCSTPSDHIKCHREKWEIAQLKSSLVIMASLVGLHTKRPALMRRAIDRLRLIFQR